MAKRRHHHQHHDDFGSLNEPPWTELDQAIGELLEHPNDLFPGRRTPEEPPGDEMTDEPRKGET
jgi:hypothetical protein